jgi:hypothetical protein
MDGGSGTRPTMALIPGVAAAYLGTKACRDRNGYNHIRKLCCSQNKAGLAAPGTTIMGTRSHGGCLASAKFFAKAGAGSR